MARYNSSLGILFGTLVIVLIAFGLLADDTTALRQTLTVYAQQARDMRAEYAAKVDERVTTAVSELFDKLDTNKDGAIQRHEFKGASVSMLAALHTVELPHPEVPDIKLPSTWSSLGISILLFQLLFLSSLFVLENLRVVVFPGHSLNLKRDYLKHKPSKVSVSEALTYPTPITIYERLKIAFFLLSGLFFVRFALAIFFFTLGVFAINLSVWRGRSRFTHPRWFWCCEQLLIFAGTMMMISMGFAHINVVGSPDAKAKVIVANHVCIVEVIFVFVHAHLPSFVSRVENLSVPMFKAVTDCCNAILVDRDAATSRDKTLATIKARASDAAAIPTILFPEGTCNSAAALFQFRRGAFEPGVPVQPVCLKFPGRHFTPSWNGRCVGGNDIQDLVLRLLSQFVNRLDVAFLPTYTPTAEEEQDALVYASHVQAMLASVLDMPVSDATFKDYVVAIKEHARRRKERGSKKE